jgi:Uma2 family endonuclease
MSAAAVPLTADDLLAMPEGKSFELVDGELVELKMSQESSWIAGRIHFHLVLVGERGGLGWAYPEGTGYACFPDDPNRVRKPDASFVLRSRQPGGPSSKGFGRVVPDLVVEVISPSDLAWEVNEKIAQWLDAGVGTLWEVLPATKTVMVHRPGADVQRLQEGDELTATGLIPDFRVRVGELFPASEPA